MHDYTDPYKGYSCQPFSISFNHLDHASLDAEVLELLPEQTSTSYKPTGSHRRCSHPNDHSYRGIRLALPLDQHVVSKVSAKADYTDNQCLNDASGLRCPGSSPGLPPGLSSGVDNTPSTTHISSHTHHSSNHQPQAKTL